MSYYGLNPEVAGQLGESTEIDYEVVPNVINRLEYEFDDWLGDDLLASFPALIVTERLGNAIREATLTGYELAELTVTKSEMFEEIGDRKLPQFRWLKLTGEPGNDFAPSPDPDFSLVVSEKALNVLNQFNLAQCEIKRIG